MSHTAAGAKETAQAPDPASQQAALRSQESRDGVAGQTVEFRGPSGRRGQVAMWLVLLAYFLLASLYNIAVPPGEAPDEPSHAQFVEILLQTGQLPTIPRDSVRYSYEAEQPPLYYVLQAVWMRLLWPSDHLFPSLVENPRFSFSDDTSPNAYMHDNSSTEVVPVHLMRLLSTLLGMLTLVLIWRTACLAWPESQGTALLAVGFAALMPGFTFVSGTINNDALAATTGAAVVLCIVCMLCRGVTLRIVLLTGAALGFGLLSKRSLLALLPPALLTPLVATNKPLRSRLASSVIVGAVALAIGVWPFVANLMQYGDPFATQATMAAKQEIASPLADTPGFWLQPFYMVGLFNSLWGVFGLRNIELPGIVYALYYALLVLGLAGAFLKIRGTSAIERKVVLICSGLLLLVYAGVAYQNTQFWAIQGRLLLPALAGMALLVGRGLSVLASIIVPSSRARRLGVYVLLATMALVNLYSLTSHVLAVYFPAN